MVHHFGRNHLSSNVALLLPDACQLLFFKLLSAVYTLCFISQAILHLCTCFQVPVFPVGMAYKKRAEILEN